MKFRIEKEVESLLQIIEKNTITACTPYDAAVWKALIDKVELIRCKQEADAYDDIVLMFANKKNERETKQ